MTEPIFTTLSDFTAAVAAEACDLTTSVTLLVGRIPPEAGDPCPALLDDLTSVPTIRRIGTPRAR